MQRRPRRRLRDPAPGRTACVAHVVAARRVLVREQRARDAHFVEVRVGRERLQAGVLVLPAEAPDARGAVRFQHRHFEDRSAQRRRLCVADRDDRVVRDRFDEAVAQRIRRQPERANVVFEVHPLDDVRIRRARLDQRTAERFEELVAVQMSGAVLRDLARAAGCHVLVTFGQLCALYVGPRPSATVSTSSKMKRLSLNERPGTTSSSSRSSNAGPCCEVAVGQVVEPGRRLSWERRRQRRCVGLGARPATFGVVTLGVPSGFVAGSSDCCRTHYPESVAPIRGGIGDTECDDEQAGKSGAIRRTFHLSGSLGESHDLRATCGASLPGSCRTYPILAINFAAR